MESPAHRDVDRKACAAVIARAESRLASVNFVDRDANASALHDQIHQISADLVKSISAIIAVRIEEWSSEPAVLIDCLAAAGEASDRANVLSETHALHESRQVRLVVWIQGVESNQAILQELLAALHPLLTAAIARERLQALQRDQERCQQLLENVSVIGSLSHYDLAVALADHWQADRLWLFSSKQGNGPFRIEACSAQRQLDKNAELAVQTEALVHRVFGESESDQVIDVASLPDEPALHGYASATGFRLAAGQLLALSLWSDDHSDRDRGGKPNQLAAALPDLVARAFQDHRRQSRSQNRIAIRLAKAVRRPTRWLITLAVISVLAFWPITLRIRARGRVIANSEQVVFSPVRGQIKQIFVSQGQIVSAGEPLFELIDPDLDFRASELRGEWLTVTEQRQIAESQRGELRSNANSNTVLADRRVLEVRQREVQKQLDLLDQQRSDLVIRCQNSGVATWTVSEDGSVPAPGRPIEFGERMIRIVDRTAGFRVRLEVPDHDIGEVLRQQASISEGVQNQSSLSAEFEIHSEGVRHTAVVDQISDVAVVNLPEAAAGSGRLVVPVTLRPQDHNQSIEVARPFMVDASVTGWVDCGRRPAGQVLFRKLIQRLKWTGWL